MIQWKKIFKSLLYLFVLLLLSNSAYASIQCGKYNPQVRSEWRLAQKKLYQLEADILDYKKDSFIRQSRLNRWHLNKMLKVTRCMQKKYQSTKILCYKQATGHCAPKYENGVRYGSVDELWGDKINICPPAFVEMNQRGRMANLVHELSHLCGAKDSEILHEWRWDVEDERNYMGLRAPALSLYDIIRMFQNVANNAYSYGYWVYESFCLPGVDCTYLERARTRREKRQAQ